MGGKKCICAQKEQAVVLSELNVKLKTFFFFHHVTAVKLC